MASRLLHPFGVFLLAGGAFVALYVYYYVARKRNQSAEKALKTQARVFLAIILVLGSLNLYQGLSRQYVTDRFHILFYNDPNTLETNTWFGVTTEQNPNDVWIHQEI